MEHVQYFMKMTCWNALKCNTSPAVIKCLTRLWRWRFIIWGFATETPFRHSTSGSYKSTDSDTFPASKFKAKYSEPVADWCGGGQSARLSFRSVSSESRLHVPYVPQLLSKRRLSAQLPLFSSPTASSPHQLSLHYLCATHITNSHIHKHTGDLNVA